MQAKKDFAPLSSRKTFTPKIQNRYLRGRTIAARKQLETVAALKAKIADNEMSPCKERLLKGGSEVRSEFYTNKFIYSSFTS